MIVTLMMIIMTVEMNYLEDTMILDDRQQYQNDNDEEELLRRYYNLKALPNSKEELLHRCNDLRAPFFLRHTVLTTFVTKEIRHRKRIR